LTTETVQMSKIKIFIAEDEAIIADNIYDTLEEFGYQVIEPVISYTEGVEVIAVEMPDIAILDIQLSGKKTGIDLGEHILEKYDFPFIFLTSNSDKVTFTEAKRVQPSAFLAKPFNSDELYASIELALFNFSKQKEKFINQDNLVVKDALFIKHKQRFIRINFDEILYLKSDNVYIDVFLKNGKSHVVRGSLNEYINKLSDHFIRCHRSYIVNLQHLTSVNHISVQLENVDIPIGKMHRDNLLKRLNKG
jgi:two-component system response regulator LytT